VDCEQALCQISAQLDHENRPDDRESLEAHLRDCAACAAAAEGFRLQDADLRRAFAPRRQAAVAVAERVISRLREAAEERERFILPAEPVTPWRQVRGRLAVAVGAIAALVAITFGVWYFRPERPLFVTIAPPPFVGAGNPRLPVHLTARARPAARPPIVLTAGATLQTGPGERRRVALAEGTVVYANQKTRLRLDGDRRLVLDAGEIFVEEPASTAPTPLVVQTPQSEVTAFSTRFAVRAAAATSLIVLQGLAWAGGPEHLVTAGQELDSGTRTLSVARRASHVLDWTRDLMAEAESPLVPASKFAGGALIAVDAQGQEAKLSLRKFHVDVHIEDGFARTTIDQTYFNHAPWRLEGTFYFPLPPDASLSRLAMYVDGRLMEGGMAERDYARQVYERILMTQRDPALLEWVDGSTFKMRVFPLEGRQEKRIILSYVQRLPALYGHTHYRFPAGHSLQVVGDWSFHAHVKGGAALAASSPSHPAMNVQPDGGDLVLTIRERNARTDRDVALDLLDSSAEQPADDTVRFSAAEHEGSNYLMVRYRPALAPKPERQRRDWVFLFESSGDRDPLLARVQVDVIRSLLSYAEPDDTFAVLTAGTLVRRFAAEPRPVTPENVTAAVAFLEQAHLVGALDLGRALGEAAPLLQAGQNPWLVHVGSGLTALGERRQEVLVQRLPAGARYVGVGVGKRWGRSFMKQAAEHSGGYFTQINPDESVGWRAFELLSTLNTPRLLDVKVVDAAERAVFLNFATSVAQGEELCAVARLKPGEPMPHEVIITGTLDGQPFRRLVPVRGVAGGAGYLPRTWARLEIDRLLAEDAVRHKDAIIALSKAMYVMTPFTSLLVLENEAMYQQFKVDRGRKDHWAMYPCPDKIPVVYEPDPNQPVDPRGPQKPPCNQVLQTIVVRVPPRIFNWTHQQQRDPGPVLTALQLLTAAPVTPNLFLSDTDYGLDPASAEPEPAAARQRPTEEWTRIWFTDQPSHLTPERVTSLALEEETLARSRTLTEHFRLGLSDGISNSLAFSPDGLSLVSLGDNASRGRRAQPVNANGVWIVGNEVTRSQLLRHHLRFSAQVVTAPAFVTERLEDMYQAAEGKELQDLHLAEPQMVSQQFRPFGFVNDFNPESLAASLAAEPESRRRVLYLRSARGQNAELLGSPRFGPPVYGRPSFTGDERIFTDLVAYAPGMNTSRADIEAVLEAEAVPVLATLPGRIDPAARRLIEQARRGGWQALTLPAAGERPALTVRFDGSGRYAYERVLPLGLREQVVCDGQTLLHLYPDLGVGARRTVSRFHRAELLGVVPWLLPPADDLARGADVECIAERTVALVPRGAPSTRAEDGKPRPYVAVHLLFAADGRLAERQLVAYPERKVLAREVYDGLGGVRRLDAEGKELAARMATLAAAAVPDLRPDTTAFVVLPLPLRSREYVYHQLGLDPSHALSMPENGCYEYLDPPDALRLFATEFAHQNSQHARLVFRKCLDPQDVRPLGFATLLSAAAADNANRSEIMPDLLQAQARHPGSPLAEYLALVNNPAYLRLQPYLGLDAARRLRPRDSLFARLAGLRDRYLRWTGNALAVLPERSRRAEQLRSLDFVRRHQGTLFGWALLTALQDRAAEKDRQWQRDLADAWKLFAGEHTLGYVADYERARCLLLGDQRGEAWALFQDLYTRTFNAGQLPPLDGHCREALLGPGRGSSAGPRGPDYGSDPWDRLLNNSVARLVADGHRVAAVVLAWQCWQLGDQPLAANLLDRALAGLTADKDRLPVTLAAVEYLWRTQQFAPADDLLQTLLDDPKYGKQPRLWRMGAHLAEQRGQSARAGARLEQALALEYEHLPETIDLQALRADYGKLLDHFQTLATAAATLQAGTPADLLARTVRAADRWRAQDRDQAAACQAAARVLRALGADELAWEYLTTPHGVKPNEGEPWLGLAQTLSREGDLALADRAYLVASEAEPGNPQILWDRARNLRQAGKPVEARQLLQQIVDVNWEPRYEGIRAQARRQLNGR
jgi:ferric-dicitrate binding protein FerR (iron transport regulator)